MAIIVIFATAPNHWVIMASVAILSIAMFMPLKFVHPVRTERWRMVTLPIALAWVGFAVWAAWGNFNVHPIAHIGLLATTAYLSFAGILQQAFPEKARNA